MIKQLQTEQPVVYQTLKNCLSNDHLSHALLFSGPKGTPKLETALLVAQSLFCEDSNPFGCGTCSVCERTLRNEVADLIVLDGSKKSIKKDEILELQEQFSKTAVEKSGRKMYIINAAENATVEALNSLLKFLEEPMSQNITAILIVESTDRLLPTIVSRCQILPFRPVERKVCASQAVELGCSKTDAWLLSHFIKDAKIILKQSESEMYQKAYASFKLFLDNIKDLSSCMVEIQTEILGSKSDTKEVLGLFIDLCTTYFEEMACEADDVPYEFKKKIEKMKEDHLNLAQIQVILLETKDKLNRPFNMMLLGDQMLMKLMEVIG